MNLLEVINDLFDGLYLWRQYGGAVQKAVTVVQAIDAIDNGHIITKIEKVLLANGIDVASMIASASGVLDLTSIKGIQAALNACDCVPPLAITGVLDEPTLAAVRVFEANKGMIVDAGIPGPLVIAALRTAIGTTS